MRLKVKLIEDRLGRRPDVTGLHFDFVGKRMVVEGPVPPQHVERLVADLGMTGRVGEVADQSPFGCNRRLLLGPDFVPPSSVWG